MLCGGVNDAKEADSAVQEICESVKSGVEEKLGSKCQEFKAKAYKTQVVAGTNYFVKVHIGDAKHVHLRIYKDLQGKISLHSLQVGKTHEDDLEYF